MVLVALVYTWPNDCPCQIFSTIACTASKTGRAAIRGKLEGGVFLWQAIGWKKIKKVLTEHNRSKRVVVESLGLDKSLLPGIVLEENYYSTAQ